MIPAQISFLPVEPRHYPLLRKWLGEPHMQEWWGEPDEELGFIRDMVEGRDTTRPFLIALDGTPVGYVQYWFIGHHQNAEWIAGHPWLAELPSDTVGVDLSIGDADNSRRASARRRSPRSSQSCAGRATRTSSSIPIRRTHAPCGPTRRPASGRSRTCKAAPATY